MNPIGGKQPASVAKSNVNDIVSMFRFSFNRALRLLPETKLANLQLLDGELDALRCVVLVNTLLAHLFGLNQEVWKQVRHSLGAVTEVNSRPAAFELLCALLHEIENLCDVTNQWIDTVMSQLHNAPSVHSVNATESWLVSLQSNVQLLLYGRMALVDIATRFPLPAFYRTESNTTLLNAHLQATYSNTATVIQDAEVVINSLVWFRNGMHLLSSCN